MLVPKRIGLLIFIPHFSFSKLYCSITKLFSSFKGWSKWHIKYRFLMVTFSTSTFFLRFSIDLPNITLFLNLTVGFLILLTSFAASLCKSVLRWICIFKNGSCLDFNIIWIFLIVTLNWNNVLTCFDCGLCIFFYCLDLG